ncbi:MAG: hypothetical protein ACT6R2_14815 [Blastomonas fulva]
MAHAFSDGRDIAAGGAGEKRLGIELARLVTKTLWLSVGYNITGLQDCDLTAAASVSAAQDAGAMFAPGSSSLREDRLAALDALAERLKAEPELGVRIRVDASADGDLATAHGDAFALYLRSRGVEEERIAVGGESAAGAVVASVEMKIGVEL